MAIESPPSISISQARSILEAQPFSVLIGAELDEFGGRVAVLKVAARPDLLQQNGFLHGGVLAYAIDNAVTFAAGTVLGPAILTSGIAVTYLRPARSDIRATATVVDYTKKQAVIRCEVTCLGQDGHPVVVASGQGTVALAG